MSRRMINHYERLLEEHQWMRSGFHWTVVQTGSPSPSLEEIGMMLSRTATVNIEEEVNVAVGADLFPKRSIVSVDRQEEGYFLFQAVDGGVDEPDVLSELTGWGKRAWSITSVLYRNSLAYAVDGELRLTWSEIPYGNLPNAHDQFDDDLVFIQEICAEAGIPFGLPALMAVIDLSSGVRMDINWPHAPRPAIILDNPIW